MLSANLTQIILLLHNSAIVSLQRFLNINVEPSIMNRLTRKFVSLISIVAVLFAQLAVSAYACPMQFQGLDDVVANVNATEPDEGVRGATSPALCKKHCEDGQQNINDSSQALAECAFEAAPTIALVTQPATLRDVSATPPSLRNATAPPLSIRHCCFRI